MNRRWTAEEEQYIDDNWGIVAIKGIAKKLNRTVNAVNIRASKMGKGPFVESGEYITLNELAKQFGRTSINNYTKISWIKNRSFPVKKQKINKAYVRIVHLDSFWKWASENKNFLDFATLEKNALGKEPDWVDKQRSVSIKQSRIVRCGKWTEVEELQLKTLLNSQKYSYKEISEKLHRTCGAIQKRCLDLGIKERPVSADNHIKWTNSEVETLIFCLSNLYTYELMSEKLNKSAKAIRGKVYRMYGTENLDMVKIN